MEIIFHELASGKDSVLSQVLSVWSKACDKKFADLQLEFCDSSNLCEIQKRPRSVDLGDPHQSAFQGHLEEVIQLRALLSTEVEALQQIRMELEDSQSMSEVHLQLERATMDNRRFQSALKMAHEQISELYFNKRVLEAEMEALRTDHERKLSEAQERIRMAEKAVVAVTSSRIFNKPTPAVSPDLDAANQEAKKVASNGKDERITVHAPFASFKQARQKTVDSHRFKQYATFNFDEFDSLDEEDHDVDDESPAQPEAVEHSPPDPPLTSASPSGEETNDSAARDPQPQISEEPVPMVDSIHQSASAEIPTAIHSPTSSSTPRKILGNIDEAPVQPVLLKDLSADWNTPIVRVESDSVPRADYLKLLDELDDLRQEVENLRSARSAGEEVPVARETDLGPTRQDPGLTEQLHDLVDQVEQLPIKDVSGNKRESLLPPVTQGATRIFDWSVSPNQSAPSVEAIASLTEEDQDDVDDQEADTPVRQTITPQCQRCLELQAELIASEALSCAQLVEASRITEEKLSQHQVSLERLQTHVDQQPSQSLLKDTAVQSEALTDSQGSCAGAKHSVKMQTDSVIVTALTSETQTVPMVNGYNDDVDDENLSVVVDKYSKLATDAACICLALTQRLASLNHQTASYVEPIAESGDSFNSLLNELCDSPNENGGEFGKSAYGAGYKMLAPALTQLNAQVELLASIFDTESEGGPKKDLLKAVTDTASIVETERRQLQAELERRMVLFEQNHTSSLMELESSRRALIDQLAAAEEMTSQLKHQADVLQQKLQAKERFLAEQTEERELERDEFRVELNRLKEELRTTKSELLSAKLVSGDRAPNDVNLGSRNPLDSRRHTFDESWTDHRPFSDPHSWSHLCDNTGQFSSSHAPDLTVVDAWTSTDSFERLICDQFGLFDVANINVKTLTDELDSVNSRRHDVAVQTTDRIDCIYKIPQADACTETKDLDTGMVTTMTTTRTLDAKAAAAFFQHLTLTEQSTVVTFNKQTEVGADRSCTSNTPSQPTELTGEDTGIELSRGLTQTESPAHSAPLSDSPVEAIRQDASVQSTHPLTSSTSTNTARLGDRLTFNQGTQTLSDTQDMGCDTVELQLEVIPAADLNRLVEQQAATEMTISKLHDEIGSLRNYQDDLQADYNLLQDMLDSRENELERYAADLLETQTRCAAYEKEITERKNVVLERDEDVFLLTEENEALKQKLSELEQNIPLSKDLCDIGIQAQYEVSQIAVATECLTEDGALTDVETDPHLQEKHTAVLQSTFDDLSKTDSTDSCVPEHVQVQLLRLQEESTRLFSLSNETHGATTDHTLTTGEYADTTSRRSAVEDLVRANTALKNTLNKLSNVLDSYEIPSAATPSRDQIHQLIRCTANALSSDELVWMNILQTSIAHGAGEVASQGHDETVHRAGWSAISRVVDQLTAFIKQEHKYRECLMQVHLAEQQCLDNELKSALNRSDQLSSELERFGERLESHKQALTRADNLNLCLTNQVNNLKSEQSRLTSELEKERSGSAEKQSKIDQLNVQLAEEKCLSAGLQQQIGQLKSETAQLEKELAEKSEILSQSQDALCKMLKRAEAAEQEVTRMKSRHETPLTHKGVTPSPVKNGRKSVQHTPPQLSCGADESLFNVINSLSTTLSAARKSADKAERHACELQSVNHGLRLNLAETELRLLPLLTSLSPDTWTLDSPLRTKSSSSANRRTPLQSPYRPSSKLDELKGVCTRLLSMASAEDEVENEQANDPTDSSDEEDRLMTNDQSYYNNGSPVFHSGPSKMCVNAERDLRALQDEAIARTGLNPLHSAVTRSSNHVSASHVTSISEQTVPIERFRSLHTRCLRAEGHRRALSFQKRYLVLLLGGFRCTEESVIASLGRPESTANMDQSSYSTADSADGYLRCSLSPHRRFRTVARVALVVSRMHRLVNRWKRLDTIPSMSTTQQRTSFNSNTNVVSPPSRVPLRELPTETPINRTSLPSNRFTQPSSARTNHLPTKTTSVSTESIRPCEGQRLRSYPLQSDKYQSPLRDSNPTASLLNSINARSPRTISVDLYTRRAKQESISRMHRSPPSSLTDSHSYIRSPPKNSIQTPIHSIARQSSRDRSNGSRNLSNVRRVPFR